VGRSFRERRIEPHHGKPDGAFVDGVFGAALPDAAFRGEKKWGQWRYAPRPIDPASFCFPGDGKFDSLSAEPPYKER
jgi:hypothetical protein